MSETEAFDEGAGEAGWVVWGLRRENEQLKARLAEIEETVVAREKRRYCGYDFWPDWVCDLFLDRKLRRDHSSAGKSKRGEDK